MKRLYILKRHKREDFCNLLEECVEFANGNCKPGGRRRGAAKEKWRKTVEMWAEGCDR
jgi:hypothetical protein